MTRIERLPSIVASGLVPDNVCRVQGIQGVEIGYRHIKDRRARREVPCGVGGTLADYVPFYYAPRSPMLYAITAGFVSAEAARVNEIVYLVTSTQRLRRAGLTVVGTNRHAELDYAEFSDADDVLDGDGFVDWPLMQETYWNNTPDDPDRKERRQAECLVHPSVTWNLFDEVVAQTDDARQRAEEAIQSAGGSDSVLVRPNWYF